MKNYASRQAELTSLGKKRKLPEQEIPLPKQVCRSWDWSKEVDEIGSEESTNSNSFFHSNSDSFMSIDDDEEAKTDSDLSEKCSSEEPSSASSSWGGNSLLYSSENRTSINASSSDEQESLSSRDQHDSPQHHVVESGGNVDLGFAEYGYDEIKNCTDKGVEDLLYSNRVASGSGYVLSSGRWSVDQG